MRYNDLLRPLRIAELDFQKVLFAKTLSVSEVI